MRVPRCRPAAAAGAGESIVVGPRVAAPQPGKRQESFLTYMTFAQKGEGLKLPKFTDKAKSNFGQGGQKIPNFVEFIYGSLASPLIVKQVYKTLANLSSCNSVVPRGLSSS